MGLAACVAPVSIECRPLGSAIQHSTVVLESKELLSELVVGAFHAHPSPRIVVRGRLSPIKGEEVAGRLGLVWRMPRRPVSRVLYPAFWEGRTAAIYLGPPLPTGSSGQPGDGPDSLLPLLGLAPDGVCLASDVTTGAVSSYLAFSPLPTWIADAPRVRAVCFCSTFRRVAPPRR